MGGLYGMALGSCFFGESMFARTRDASKVALYRLCQRLAAEGFTLIDCQQETAHLASLGAVSIPREAYLEHLRIHVNQGPEPGLWRTHAPNPSTDG